MAMNSTRYCPKCGEESSWDHRFCQHCRAELPPSTPGQRAKDRLDADETELGLVEGQLLADRFEIQKMIGKGGMGRVYLAKDNVLDRPVAIKVLREALSRDSGSVRRLVEEAKASIRLAHPNVVRIDDYHDAGMVKFLAMEFVEGETLADRLGRDGKLAEEESRKIAVEVCKGLEHAHENKVIHRDLKPGNILLGKDGKIKIADFGIARVVRDTLSRLNSQQDSGTLLYMSPEQLLGKSSEASDVYSLGVVLYEMLSGDPPFKSGDVAYQIREIPPEQLQEISPALAEIVLKCLAKKPEQRFKNVSALKEELDGTAERNRRDEQRRADEIRRAEEEKKQAEDKSHAEEAGRREEGKCKEEKRKETERRGRAELEPKLDGTAVIIDQGGKFVQQRRDQLAAALEAGRQEHGESLLERGGYDRAEVELQAVLRSNPGNDEAEASLKQGRAGRASADERGKHRPLPAPVIAGKRTGNGGRAAMIALAVFGAIILIWYLSNRGRQEDVQIPGGEPTQQTSPAETQARPAVSLQPEVQKPAVPSYVPGKKSGKPHAEKAEPVSDAKAVEIAFVSIPAGRFWMGCSPGDGQCYGDENPRHEVEITRSFQLGKYEVTQGQWMKVMGSNPSSFKGDDRLPVEQVSWNDVQAFIAKLNALNDGYRYRLPTEAEWEYAARGGTTGPYYASLDEIGWYHQNSERKTHPAGQKQPNGFGLYDMTGNVWEWCSNWYGEGYYVSSPFEDPRGPSSGQNRVLRGGSCLVDSGSTRVSFRLRGSPEVSSEDAGFRVCREPL
jgi:formylglycine-generating enzyme required for sulfatase activity/tRNA A-37 threonylcarbamoyl transferase component Bud32